MRHHHEEGRGPRGRHGEHSEHGEHGRRGGGRRQRFFGHGELRLVILDILTRNASHGYELIKEIETLTQGNYSPSPGVIYPTLDLLQDQGLISVADENGRKKSPLPLKAVSCTRKTWSSWSIFRPGCRRAWWAVNCVKIRR